MMPEPKRRVVMRIDADTTNSIRTVVNFNRTSEVERLRLSSVRRSIERTEVGHIAKFTEGSYDQEDQVENVENSDDEEDQTENLGRKRKVEQSVDRSVADGELGHVDGHVVHRVSKFLDDPRR